MLYVVLGNTRFFSKLLFLHATVAHLRIDLGPVEHRLPYGHADNIHHLDCCIAVSGSRRQPQSENMELDVQKVLNETHPN